MMKKQAILIQCHNKPEQINVLIDTFPEEQFDFYVHVDKKSDIQKDIFKKSNVHFAESRVCVRWGRYAQVAATLVLMRMIHNPTQYSYCHLISGNDFPVKPIDWFNSLFCEENCREYIETKRLPGTSTWSWSGLDRMYCYYPNWMNQRPANKFMKAVRVAYREFVMRTGILKRKDLAVEDFYGGSSWWSITGKMISWMLEYIDDNPRFIKCFDHGVCVDEVFFSTLAMLSPYKENIEDNHMRYMNWSEPGNNSGGPAILKRKDIDKLISSEFAFARKFTDLDTIIELKNKMELKSI